MREPSLRIGRDKNGYGYWLQLVKVIITDKYVSIQRPRCLVFGMDNYLFNLLCFGFHYIREIRPKVDRVFIFGLCYIYFSMLFLPESLIPKLSTRNLKWLVIWQNDLPNYSCVLVRQHSLFVIWIYCTWICSKNTFFNSVQLVKEHPRYTVTRYDRRWSIYIGFNQSDAPLHKKTRLYNDKHLSKSTALFDMHDEVKAMQHFTRLIASENDDRLNDLILTGYL